jgi:hypothetical protein
MVNDGNSDDDHDDIETPGVIPQETDEDDQNHDNDHQQDQDATAYDSEPDGQELDDKSTEESDSDSEDEQDNEPTTRSGRAIRTTQREDYVYTSIGSDPKSLQCAQFLQKTLKTRGCADGRPQRLWTNKQDVSSPTPAIECIKYILAIIAFERRDVASFDLPAQFLQTEMKELLHLRITGAVALLLVESDPKRWKKHLRNEQGRPVIYVVCKKAIYGTLSAAILAYRKLTSYFKEWGFEMNPYDACVWNKMINGTQMTVVFHVNDGLVSHIDPTQVTNFLKQLKGMYGNTDPLTIRQGKHHDYLGMTIDPSKDGEVMITMYDYVVKEPASTSTEHVKLTLT